MSDLSDAFGGAINYSFKERDEIQQECGLMSQIKQFTIGKMLAKRYLAEVKKERRALYPMEDWIRVNYNHVS